MTKDFKKTMVLSLGCLLIMTSGLTLLIVNHHIPGLIFGLLLIIMGFLPIVYMLVYLLGQLNVYQFIHYYYNSNFLINHSHIIGKLSFDDIMQLKAYDKDLFKNTSVLIDTDRTVSANDQTIVTGWIKASNKKDALSTLHYTNFNQIIIK